MNQILFSNDNINKNNIENTFDNNSTNNINKTTNKNFLFKILFIVSNALCFVFIIYYALFNYSISKNEKISKTLSDNFEIKTLYSSNQSYETNLSTDNYVIGIIEINSIGISYPIISESTDENLKISPCKFFRTSAKRSW